MDVSIGIVSYNTKESLARCLESIFQKTKGVRFEVIVVDNCSSDDTPTMLKEHFPEVRFVKNIKNKGFSKAVNQAFRVSKGDYFFLLNPDTEFVTNVALELYKVLRSKLTIGVVGPKIIYPDGRLHRSCRRFMTLPVAILDVFQIGLYFPDNIITKRYNYDNWDHYSPREVDWLTGAAFMTRKDIFQEVNMCDERFFIYSEDMDYCLKVQKAGYTVFFNPQTVIIHHHAQGGTQYTSVRQIDYYKSLYLYIDKNLGKAKAFTFRISIIIWALVYLLIRLCKSPFLSHRGRVLEYLRVPLRLLLFKGHGE